MSPEIKTRRATRSTLGKELAVKRNVTECNNVEETLSPVQIQAIAHLLSGESISSTAESLEVNRVTIHRWLRDDFAFQATLNRGKRDLSDAIDARLQQMASRALETIQEALEDGDRRVALSVLKGCGYLDGKRTDIGPGSEDVLELEAAESEELLSMRRVYAKKL